MSQGEIHVPKVVRHHRIEKIYTEITNYSQFHNSASLTPGIDQQYNSSPGVYSTRSTHCCSAWPQPQQRTKNSTKNLHKGPERLLNFSCLFRYFQNPRPIFHKFTPKKMRERKMCVILISWNNLLPRLVHGFKVVYFACVDKMFLQKLRPQFLIIFLIRSLQVY